jgi:hypothetical protein
MDADEYRRSLVQIRCFLLEVGDQRWGPRLDSWIRELDSAVANRDKKALLQHIGRTKKAIGGMGSIGDIVVSREAGYSVPNDDIELDKLNARLLDLVSKLYLDVEALERPA